MQAILPGRPEAQLQATSSVVWQEVRLVVYITNNILIILRGPRDLVQSIRVEQANSLVSVLLDGSTGIIAASSLDEVYIFRPDRNYVNGAQWTFFTSTRLDNPEQKPPSLSWGCDGDLLVGYSALSLFRYDRTSHISWQIHLPRPVRCAYFSPNANLIASTGWHDCLIKIWRRQSSDPVNPRFDFCYLRHAAPVTHLQWHGQHRHPDDDVPHSRHNEHVVNATLYSICADHKLRIWTGAEQHALQTLRLWHVIDLDSAIQTRHLAASDAVQDRYVFIMDGHDFARSIGSLTETSDKTHETIQDRHAMEHLKEVGRSKPDIVVITDGKGHMSAWGLENVGSIKPRPTDIFNVAHVENFYFPFSRDSNKNGRFAMVHSWPGESAGSWILLAHSFDGSLVWYSTRLDQFIDPRPRDVRIVLEATWTGHSDRIQALQRTEMPNAVLVQSQTCVSCWDIAKFCSSEKSANSFHSLPSPLTSSVQRVYQLQGSTLAMILRSNVLELWTYNPAGHRPLTSMQYADSPSVEAMVEIGSVDSSRDRFLAIFKNDLSCSICKITIPDQNLQTSTGSTTGFHISIVHELSTPREIQDQPLAVISSTDKIRHSAQSKDIDSSTDLVMTCDISGHTQNWRLIWNSDNVPRLTSISQILLGNRKASVLCCNGVGDLAVIDSTRTSMSIWSMRQMSCEFQTRTQAQELYSALSWTETRGSKPVLALSSQKKIRIFATLRSSCSITRPAWSMVHNITLDNMTCDPICDLVFADITHLFISTGSQVFLPDLYFKSEDLHSSQNIANLEACVEYRGAQVPLYHPEVIENLFHMGQRLAIRKVLTALDVKARFHTHGDPMDSNLGLGDPMMIDSRESSAQSTEEGSRDEYVAEGFRETLQNLERRLGMLALPYLVRSEQVLLQTVLLRLDRVEAVYSSTDEAAQHFCYISLQGREQLPARVDRQLWQSILWAIHSKNQDVLIDMVRKQRNGQYLWQDARNDGMFMWLQDSSMLKAQFELLARSEYTKSDDKNPIDCSLHYLALRKKSVLLGLWRMAVGNKEQMSTQKILKNDFSDNRWKTAALKNAYALMGKRRFEYAAAWFLLADNLRDATNICANQLDDVQLAITIARLYEGDGGPVFRELVDDRLIPNAEKTKNPYMAAWGHWMLQRHRKASEALFSFGDKSAQEVDTSQRNAAQDPAALEMYRFLRKVDKRASLEPEHEWSFVLKAARQYRLMNCMPLALSLVRNWQFLSSDSTSFSTHGVDMKTPENQALPAGKDNHNSNGSILVNNARPQVAPTFQEPEANSLLDSFGF